MSSFQVSQSLWAWKVAVGKTLIIWLTIALHIRARSHTAVSLDGEPVRPSGERTV